MSVFPHSFLCVDDLRSVVVSGPHIQILDTKTGHVVCSTASLADDDKVALLKSGPIRCAAVNVSREYMATIGDDKILKVWSLEHLKLLSSREVPKRGTEIAFTHDSSKILVSDKFGDVFSYPLHPVNNAPASSTQQRDQQFFHENRSGGELVLGHASLLTSFLLTPDERYIITADRDEHIRVSWYPQGFNIERYCLGHTKFVSAIHVPAFAPSSLISGGGDPMLKIWDWMSGEVLNEIQIYESVWPFIRMRPPKRKKGKDRGESEDDETEQNAWESSKQQDDDASMGEGNFRSSSKSKREDEAVLAIHKIDTFDSEGSQHILFSVVGATSLFHCQWPSGNATPTVENLDFGAPVLDFIVADDGTIILLLDGGWSKANSGAGIFATGAMLVRGRLTTSHHKKWDPLLNALNSTCLIPASPQELQSLDLYSDLSSLPKNTEVEHDPMDEGPLEAALHEDEEGLAMHGKKLSKKALGRLKHKRALLAKTKIGGEPVGVGTPEERRSDTKRPKSGPP